MAGEGKPEKIRRRTVIDGKFEQIIAESHLTGNVLFIGHSWMVGVTDYLHPANLEARFSAQGVKTKIDPVAVEGAHLYELEAALKGVIKKRDGRTYDFLVLMIGGNDVELPAEEITRGIERIYALARDNNLSDHIYVCNLHPYIPDAEKSDGLKSKTLKNIRDTNDALARSSVIPNRNLINIYELMEARGDYALHPSVRKPGEKGSEYNPVKDKIVREVVGEITTRRTLAY